MTAYDPDGPGGQGSLLIVGGGFNSADGNESIRKIAAWDGQTWSAMGSGMSGGTPSSTVRALVVWDPDESGPEPGSLYAGGEFTVADGHIVNRIARWNGSIWQPLGSGMDSHVYCMTIYDGELIVGGNFTHYRFRCNVGLAEALQFTRFRVNPLVASRSAHGTSTTSS